MCLKIRCSSLEDNNPTKTSTELIVLFRQGRCYSVPVCVLLRSVNHPPTPNCPVTELPPFSGDAAILVVVVGFGLNLLSAAIFRQTSCSVGGSVMAPDACFCGVLIFQKATPDSLTSLPFIIIIVCSPCDANFVSIFFYL